MRPRTLPARMCGASSGTAYPERVCAIAASLAVQVLRQPCPGLLAQRLGRHHAVDARERDAAQDEGRHAGRQVHALRQAAGGDRAAVFGAARRALARVWLPTESTAPAQRSLASGLPGADKLGAVDDFGRRQALQSLGLVPRPPGGGDDAVASLDSSAMATLPTPPWRR